MAGSSNTPVKSLYVDDCRTIQALANQANTVNHKLQQAYMPNAVSLRNPEPDDHLFKPGPSFNPETVGLIEELSEVYIFYI